eukprot:5112683-Amphidinium_carterae.1
MAATKHLRDHPLQQDNIGSEVFNDGLLGVLTDASNMFSQLRKFGSGKTHGQAAVKNLLPRQNLCPNTHAYTETKANTPKTFWNNMFVVFALSKKATKCLENKKFSTVLWTQNVTHGKVPGKLIVKCGINATIFQNNESVLDCWRKGTSCATAGHQALESE